MSRNHRKYHQKFIINVNIIDAEDAEERAEVENIELYPLVVKQSHSIDTLIAKLQHIVKQQRETKEYRDLEYDHIEADGILLEIIDQYCPKGKEVIKAYNQINMWYA